MNGDIQMGEELDASFLDDPIVAHQPVDSIQVPRQMEHNTSKLRQWLVLCMLIFMQLQVESTQEVAQTRLDIVHQPISTWTLQEVEEASQSQKVVCDEDCIRQLLGTSCRHPSCEEDINVKQAHIGATLSLQWQCRRGHQGC